MGKLSALLVGTFLLLVLAYSELASSFTPLINWLGPILGIPLQFLLGLVFMMIGNSLDPCIIIFTPSFPSTLPISCGSAKAEVRPSVRRS